MCPYLSTLMEHCYKCHGGSWVTTDEWQPDEVVICDGWTQEIIERQCNTPHYIEGVWCRRFLNFFVSMQKSYWSPLTPAHPCISGSVVKPSKKNFFLKSFFFY